MQYSIKVITRLRRISVFILCAYLIFILEINNFDFLFVIKQR